MGSTIEIANRAEEAIKKLLNNDIEFNRKIMDPFPPDPYQYFWMEEYNRHPRCVHVAAPRTRKTTTASAHFLKKMLKYPYTQVLGVTPSSDQMKKQGFGNIYEWVARNDLLKAFVKRSATGKLMLHDDYVEFYSRSRFKAFGINSNLAGYNATDIWVDETDSMPPDEFKKIFDRAMAKTQNGLPAFYLLSGMIVTKGNLHGFENDPMWYSIGSDYDFRMDMYLALELGILDIEAIRAARGMYTQEEWLRLMLLIYVESKNYIWESKLHKSQMVGQKWDLRAALPKRGKRYVKSGQIAFGIDMGAQGSGDDASDFSLQVIEGSGRYRRWLYGETWAPTTDPSTLITDWADIWEYFMPDGGYGDALDANLIAQFNTELYKRGLVEYDWTLFGDNSAHAWKEWAEVGLMTPLRNHGIEKHNMYTSFKTCIDNVSLLGEDNYTGNVLVFPPFMRQEGKHWKNLGILLKELANLQEERTKAGYLSISRIKKQIEDDSIGFHGILRLKDDNPDAAVMANRFLDFLMSQENTGEMNVTAKVIERAAS